MEIVFFGGGVRTAGEVALVVGGGGMLVGGGGVMTVPVLLVDGLSGSGGCVGVSSSLKSEISPKSSLSLALFLSDIARAGVLNRRGGGGGGGSRSAAIFRRLLVDDLSTTVPTRGSLLRRVVAEVVEAVARCRGGGGGGVPLVEMAAAGVDGVVGATALCLRKDFGCLG